MGIPIPGKDGLYIETGPSTRHLRWHAANRPFSSTPCGDGGGWKSTGASLWAYRYVITGQEPIVDGFPASPYFIQFLNKLWSWQGVVIRGAFVDLPGTKVLVAVCLGDAVDGSISQTHATSNSTLQHAFMGKCKHLTLNTFRGWTGHY